MSETPLNGGSETEPRTDHRTAPSQLVLPETDAGMQIRGRAVDRLIYLIPGVILLVVGAFVLLYRFDRIGQAIFGTGTLATAVGGYLLATTPSHISGIDRVQGWLTARLRQRSLPRDRAGAADIHGVEQILDDGSVEMDDGRIVRFARLHGRNTDRQTAAEEQTMINALRKGIDSSIEDNFSVYSTSTCPEPRDITEKYREVWLSEWDEDDGDASDTRGYLESIIDWEPTRCEMAMATEWEHYLVVAVGPDAIDAPPVGTTDTTAQRKQQQVEAERRLTTLGHAFSGVTGVEVEEIGGAAHARVIARHWAGAQHPFHVDEEFDRAPVSVWPDYDPDALEQPTAEPARTGRPSILSRLRTLIPIGGATTASPSSTPGDARIKEVLAGSQYDERPDGDLIVVGEQYCRTLRVADWPTHPTVKFLKRLHTLRGVDADVHLRFKSRDTDAVKAQLKDETGEIDASIMERKEASNPLDAGVLEDEMDAFVTLFNLLHHTDVQPWDLTMYVTVRAGNRQALAHAEDLIENGHVEEGELTLDIAKQQALEDAFERVTVTLTDANLTPVTDANRQGELFTSCSPTGPDVYAEQSFRDPGRLTATGTVAATFPPVATTVHHEEGAELGRFPSTGRIIAPDPFATPPAHRLTVGKSGSGKTWGVSKQAVRWYVSNPSERTLIFIDTEEAFSGITGLLNGTQITLDGRVTINPLRMEPLAEAVQETTQVDPFEMKHTLVSNLLLDIIADTPDSRDRFGPLVRDGVRTALTESGIDPDDPSTHTPANSPTMADVRDAVEAIGETPNAYVRSEFEAEEITKHVGALLRRLSGFAEDGEYSFLTGESDAVIEPGDVTYLDLQQLEGLGSAADRTTILILALGQVYETAKKAPEKTMCVIDEAHYLLESKHTLQWLEEGARQLRKRDAGLWFISQSPEDFTTAEDDDEARYKGVIKDQAQITEVYRVEDTDKLDGYGLNSEQLAFVTEEATMGEVPSENHTDCLLDHPEIEGWMRARISVSPAERDIFSYDPSAHGPYHSYIDRNWS